MSLHNENNFNSYPTAIIGAGCAGLSLAYKLIGSQQVPLTILEAVKSRKEHIWAFWDDGNKDLETANALAIKSWNKWSIKTKLENVTLSGEKFKYTALSSLRFENYLKEKIKNEGFHILNGFVSKIKHHKGRKILVLKDGREIIAKNIFDSRPPNVMKGAMYQHFVGWNIETLLPSFDKSEAILMDFRVSQDKGIHFIYLLPFTNRKALIESTVFSNTILPNEWYEKQIKKYLKDNYPNSEWKIINKEKGIIPLTNLENKISMGIPIGMNANAMRVSSGYAFAQIQKQISHLVKSLALTKKGYKINPGSSYLEQLMDKIFLDVLKNNNNKAPEIFLNMFKSLNGDEFARFMNGYSSLWVKGKIINAQEKNIFIKSALKVLFT
ncbi:MAG: hypothetical protein CBC47_06620 [Alphaproteobacteria bacterium TMED87]|nr:hypothetical protein [Rhodospirillaceae bacterium]OUV08906.1 MAG: hypothetical protein CBC47_06620 [Alphaproteobacteria bacterium TMED87]